MAELGDMADQMPVDGQPEAAAPVIPPTAEPDPQQDASADVTAESPVETAAEPPAETAAEPPEETTAETPTETPPQDARCERPQKISRFDQLPTYGRSLMRIKVPVVATLAQKKQPVQEILELGPGAIIQFEKSCEEMLELEVGNQQVAVGEAVKVGDKFGLRITSVTLPDERFIAVKGKREGRRTKD